MKKNKVLLAGLSSSLLLGAIALLEGNVAHANNEAGVVSAGENIAEKKDYKNLADGEYAVDVAVKNANNKAQDSMADGAVEKPTKIVVQDGEYKAHIQFNPLTFLNTKGYLGDIATYENNEKVSGKVLEWYKPEEKDGAFDAYKKAYPDRTAYPKVVEIPIHKNNIDATGKLEEKVNVYVPVMASINPVIGHQDALPIFDFSKLTTVKLAEKKEEAKPVVEKEVSYYNIDVKDEAVAKTQVRRAVEPKARVIEKDGAKYLVVRYFSKQNWGGEYRYDNGLRELAYNYDGSKTLQPLTSKVVETGTHYAISEVEIPLEENSPIYLFGESQLNAITGTTQITHGVITLGDKATLVNPLGVESPKVVRVSQLGSFLKEDTANRLPFDFEKNGQLYSPYTAENGTKFKLADGRYSVEIQLDRPSFGESNTRYIRYTLDGSEPTKNSQAADFRSQSADATLNANLYRIFVDPLADIPNFSKNGGNVTVKLKAFNADGSQSSETQTYVLPFSKYTVDEVAVDVPLKDKTFSGKLTSANNYVLSEDATLKVENVDPFVEKIIFDEAKKLGLEDLSVRKLSVVDSKGQPYTPSYAKGWTEDKNPLLKLELTEYATTDNKQLYLYENGELKLLPTSFASYSKKYSANINKQTGDYLFATKKSADLLPDYIQQLKDKLAAANTALATAPNTLVKVKLGNEIDAVNKSLKREKSLKLDRVITHLQNLDKYSSLLLKDSENEKFLKEKAQVLLSLANNEIYKQLLTEESYNNIKAAAENIKNNKEDVAQLKTLLPELDKALADLEYVNGVETIEYTIENYSRPGVPSMASGVFAEGARLIHAKDKTYLELPLKTMTFAGIRAHLTDLDVFKEGLRTDQFNVYSLSKYEDVDGNGKVQLYDKKLLVELDKVVKPSYDVLLGNDGMGGAKPPARLVLKVKPVETAKSKPTSGLLAEGYELPEAKIEITTNKTLVPIKFDIITEENNQLSKGERRIKKVGVPGEKEVVTTIHKVDEEVLKEEVLENKLKEPEAQIEEVGTKEEFVPTTPKQDLQQQPQLELQPEIQSEQKQPEFKSLIPSVDKVVENNNNDTTVVEVVATAQKEPVKNTVKALPNTGTQTSNTILLGVGLLLAGLTLTLRRKNK